ncbi:hypothetical protein [Microbacterium sp. 18062]|uniref:hypothetical protein n=1 Tax=Microbacterium sp. 18062 TaxID=2681410 RepID=UPI001357583E|nr:hypothetical protein [Microbacterium sp. 18062]
MARRPRTTTNAPGRILSGVLVAVLAIGVILLAYLAFQHTRNGEVEGTARPAPTFTHGATATPAPTPAPPEPTTAPVVAPGPAERLLVTGSGAIWRATAGSCGEVEPVLERSTDGGQTWADVTPRYLGIGQILALEPLQSSEAQLVALVGGGCELQALRTFTQGSFWESYPDALSAATYLDPTDPGVLVTPNARIDAPCATAWGVRTGGGTTALICDGTAYQLTDGAWLPVADDALAVTASAAGVASVSTAADCAGLAVTTTASVCAAEASPEGPAAIAASDGSTVIWSADTWVVVPTP